MQPFSASVRGPATCPVPPGEPDAERPGAGGSRYGPRTLVNHWFEERSGLGEIRTMKPLASQYEYAYRTIYMDSYCKADARRRMFKDEPHVYPGHQPELNPPHSKAAPKTTYTLDYLDPALQTNSARQPRPDAGTERHPSCFSLASRETRWPAGGAAGDPRFRGSCAPAEGPPGPCTADFHRPCATVAVPPRAGTAGCCGAAPP